MKRRGACMVHVLSSLSQSHPRGYTVELISVRKRQPTCNLTRVLVVHLVEGGSSTKGEQTNCDLTCYVKKRGKPCGAYLRGKALYTGVLLMCPVNSQNEEKLALYAVSPAHGRGGLQDEVKLTSTTVRLYARSLAHARGGSQHEEKILLLPPFTPRPYYVLWLLLPLFTYTRPL